MNTVISYFEGYCLRLRGLGRLRCSEACAASMRSFMRFVGGDICLADISSDLMQRYEAYLKAVGVTRNTSSFYMRNIRTVYKSAVEAGLVTDVDPFKKVYTGVDKTIKRAIPLTLVRDIGALDLSELPHLEFSRDMFMFSFYTRGMAFVDMAYLRKTDLRNGTLMYHRKKTAQMLTIEWTTEMQSIVDRHESGNSYLLPLITTEGTIEEERKQYKSRLSSINRNLKKIAKMVGFNKSLTSYATRHGWASIAHENNVPLSIISQGLGHDNEKTTQIYLNQLNATVIDQANRQILDLLKV